ncbi:MAG: YraN family protein [Ruminococcus sp.]|nr:YraN family protein [Ruminococcus sp.]
MRKNNYGREYEQIVCGYLESQGMKILDRNFTVSGGEADIIASDGMYICFVEVKYRTVRAVDAYSSVGFKKQGRIIKAAKGYLSKHRTELQPRFDVVFVFSDDGEIIFDYIKNAYDASQR